MNPDSDKPIVALIYDFDKTLCTQDMQNYSIELFRDIIRFSKQYYEDIK